MTPYSDPEIKREDRDTAVAKPVKKDTTMPKKSKTKAELVTKGHPQWIAVDDLDDSDTMSDARRAKMSLSNLIALDKPAFKALNISVKEAEKLLDIIDMVMCEPDTPTLYFIATTSAWLQKKNYGELRLINEPPDGFLLRLAMTTTTQGLCDLCFGKNKIPPLLDASPVDNLAERFTDVTLVGNNKEHESCADRRFVFDAADAKYKNIVG